MTLKPQALILDALNPGALTYDPLSLLRGRTWTWRGGGGGVVGLVMEVEVQGPKEGLWVLHQSCTGPARVRHQCP